MNYFERLIRRAVACPLGHGPIAQPDPFERIEPWPLDPAVDPVPAIQPSAPPAATSLVTTQTTSHAGKPPRAASVNEPLTQPEAQPISIRPGVPQDIAKHESPVATDRTPTPIGPTPLHMHDASTSGLEIADRFMRSLGTREQTPRDKTAASMPRDAPASLVAPVSATALPRDSAQRMQVIAPPMPRVPPHEPLREPDATQTGRSDSVQRSSSADRTQSSTARATAESKHIVVVERPSATGGSTAVPGAGAPYFGLGQL